jgi:hypothetical protein
VTDREKAMTGWQQAHRRTDLLNTVLDGITGTGSAQVPAAHLEMIESEFGGFDQFLLAAHQRWATAFAARLDGLLENEPDDLALALARLHADLRSARPALRALLDHYCDNPSLAAAEDRQWRQLAAATGVAELPPLQQQEHQLCMGRRLMGLADRRIRRVLDLA